jgi:hypothetical protein
MARLAEGARMRHAGFVSSGGATAACSYMLVASFVLLLVVLPVAYLYAAYHDKQQFVRNQKLCEAYPPSPPDACARA